MWDSFCVLRSDPLFKVSIVTFIAVDIVSYTRFFEFSLWPSHAVPVSPPSAVKPDKVTSTSFLLTWCPPSVDATNGSITAYILEYGESGSISLSGVAEEHTVTGLKPHTEYYVKVAAETAAGRGPFCEPVPVKTAPGSEYRYIYF